MKKRKILVIAAVFLAFFHLGVPLQAVNVIGHRYEGEGITIYKKGGAQIRLNSTECNQRNNYWDTKYDEATSKTELCERIRLRECPTTPPGGGDLALLSAVFEEQATMPADGQMFAATLPSDQTLQISHECKYYMLPYRHYLGYSLSEINYIDLGPLVRFYQIDKTGPNHPCPCIKDPYTVNDYEQKISASAMYWRMYDGNTVVCSGTVTNNTLQLTDAQRNTLKNYENVTVRICHTSTFTDKEISDGASIVLEGLPRWRIKTQAEYKIVSSQKTEIPGSKQTVNIEGDAGILKNVPMLNCETRMLELEFSRSLDPNHLYCNFIGEDEQPHPSYDYPDLRLNPGDDKKLQITFSDRPFVFPVIIQIPIWDDENNRTIGFEYKLTGTATQAQLATLADPVIQEREAYYNCSATQVKILYPGWTRISTSDATYSNPYYTIKNAKTTIQVDAYLGGCKKTVSLAVPATKPTPPTPIINFTKGPKYCASEGVTVNIENYSTLKAAGHKIFIEYTNGVLQEISSPTTNFTPQYGNASFFAGSTGGCRSASTSVYWFELLTPVQIQTQFRDTAVCVGEKIVLSVGVSGSYPSYQWYKDGVAINNTGNTYTINSAAIVDAGNYSVNVTGCGVHTSTAKIKVHGFPEKPIVSDDSLWTCNDGVRTIIHKNAEENVDYSLEEKGTPYPVDNKNSWHYDIGSLVSPKQSLTLPAGVYTFYAKNHDLERCGVSMDFTIEPKYISFDNTLLKGSTLCQQDEAANLFDLHVIGGENAISQKGYEGYEWSVWESGNRDNKVTIDNGKEIDVRNSSGNFLSEITVHTQFCKISGAEKQLTILPRPNAIKLEANDSMFCNGKKAIITANGNSAIENYRWFVNGQERRKTFENTYDTVFHNSADTIYVIGKNVANVCTRNSDTLYIESLTVDATPLIFAKRINDFCQNAPISIKTQLLDTISIKVDSNNQKKLVFGKSMYQFRPSSYPSSPPSNPDNLKMYGSDYTDGLYIEAELSVADTYYLNLYTRQALKTKQNFCEIKQDSMIIAINPAPAKFTISAVGNFKTNGDTILLCGEETIDMVASDKTRDYLWYYSGASKPLSLSTEWSHKVSQDGVAIYHAKAEENDCPRLSNTLIVERILFSKFRDSLTTYCTSPSDPIDLFAKMEPLGEVLINNYYNYKFTTKLPNSTEDGRKVAKNDLDSNEWYPVVLEMDKKECSLTTKTKVLIMGEPTDINLTVDKNDVCGGTEVTFTANPIPAGSKNMEYNWYKKDSKGQDSVIMTSKTSSITMPIREVGDYKVAAVSPRCFKVGKLSDFVHIDTKEAPNANASITRTTVNKLNIFLSDFSAITETVKITVLTESKNLFSSRIVDVANYDPDVPVVIPKSNDTPSKLDAALYLLTMVLVGDNGCTDTSYHKVPSTGGGTPIFDGSLDTAPHKPPFVKKQNPNLIESLTSTVVEPEPAVEETKVVGSQKLYTASLVPSVSTIGSHTRVKINARGEGTAAIQVVNLNGTNKKLGVVKLFNGSNEVDITRLCPKSAGMYVVQIVYSDHTTETLRGIVW